MPKKTETIVTAPENLIIAKKEYTRDERGLLSSVEYKYNEDCSVNWKAMINPKYIVLNKEKKAIIEEKYSIGFDELQTKIQEGNQDPDDIEDGYKLILLAGYKELAKIRGFCRVDYYNNVTGPEYVATKCTIIWQANYENLGQDGTIKFSSLADAHLGNTKSFATQFLNTIAENRSFVRCVRNFLNINLLGFDEIGGSSPEESSPAPASSFSATDPRFVLNNRFNELKSTFKVSWATFQKYLVEKKDMEVAADWKSIDDVPKEKAFDIIGLVNDQIEKLTEKQKKAE